MRSVARPARALSKNYLIYTHTYFLGCSTTIVTYLCEGGGGWRERKPRWLDRHLQRMRNFGFISFSFFFVCIVPHISGSSKWFRLCLVYIAAWLPLTVCCCCCCCCEKAATILLRPAYNMKTFNLVYYIARTITTQRSNHSFGVYKHTHTREGTCFCFILRSCCLALSWLTYCVSLLYCCCQQPFSCACTMGERTLRPSLYKSLWRRGLFPFSNTHPHLFLWIVAPHCLYSLIVSTQAAQVVTHV